MVETNRRKVAARLERDGWVNHGGGRYDKYKHPDRKGRIILPRHNQISPGVAADIARIAGWTED